MCSVRIIIQFFLVKMQIVMQKLLIPANSESSRNRNICQMNRNIFHYIVFPQLDGVVGNFYTF